MQKNQKHSTDCALVGEAAGSHCGSSGSIYKNPSKEQIGKSYGKLSMDKLSQSFFLMLYSCLAPSPCPLLLLRTLGLAMSERRFVNPQGHTVE